MDDDAKRKQRAPGRESFETMPPELRPFFVPGPKDSIEVAENPRLAAALAGIAMLDEMDEATRRAAAEKGGEKVHVPPVAVPSASRPKDEAPPLRVEVSMPVLTEVVARRSAAGGARAADAADATLVSGGVAGVPSPWVKTAAPEVRASALPSSLRPRESDAPPASEAGAGVPARRKTALLLALAIVVVGLGIGLRVLTSGRGPENAGHGPLPATAGAPTAPEVPPAAPEVPPAAPSAPAAVPSGTSSAGPGPATYSPPAPASAPRPRPRGAVEDPYGDASAPRPVVTAAPSAPTATATAPPPSPPPTAAPTVPAPRPTNTFDKPNYD
jgi:hypothetical protein